MSYSRYCIILLRIKNGFIITQRQVGKSYVFFGGEGQEQRTRSEYKHHTRLDYESRADLT